MEVPGLGGVDPVPVRALAAPQQVVDRGRGRAALSGRVPEGLGIGAAFGVRLQAQQRRDPVGIELAHPLKPSLAARTWPKASAGVAAETSEGARRKGLVARSSAMVVGTVGTRGKRG